MPGRKTPPATPPLREWNFDDCPSDELFNCRPYEYSRSSPLIREAVTRKRAGLSDALTEALVHVFGFGSDWIRDRRWWPLTPYLAIPQALRREWVASPVEPSDLARLCRPSHYQDTPERIIRVYIPPFSLSVVKQAFGEMLQRDYPHLLEKQEAKGVQVKLFKTGKGSQAEQDRSLLKALSARRLQSSGFTALQALALARTYRVETYASIRSYRNAARKARAQIARLEARLSAKREPR